MEDVFILGLSADEVRSAMRELDAEAAAADTSVDSTTLRSILRTIEAVGHQNITGVTMAIRYRDPKDRQSKFAASVIGSMAAVMYCMFAQALIMQEQATTEAPTSKSHVH